MLGIPYDSGQTYQTGSRFFPFFIRLCSDSIEEYSFFFEKDVRECNASDWGDIEVSFGDFEETFRRVERVINKLGDKKFVFLGGDHSITIMTVSVLRKNIRRYVHLDAHSDFEDSYLGSKFNHDTVLRRVGEILGWDKITLLGVRSMSKKAHHDLKELGVEFYTNIEIKDNPDILRDFLKKADYISLDMDFFDPSIAPEVGNPEPMGLKAEDLILTIKDWNNKYFDVVEGTPKNPGSITAILAATLLREIIIRMSCSS